MCYYADIWNSRTLFLPFWPFFCLDLEYWKNKLLELMLTWLLALIPPRKIHMIILYITWWFFRLHIGVEASGTNSAISWRVRRIKSGKINMNSLGYKKWTSVEFISSVFNKNIKQNTKKFNFCVRNDDRTSNFNKSYSDKKTLLQVQIAIPTFTLLIT